VCKSSRESWDGYAITAWEEWVDRTGAGEQVVSAATLDILLNRDRFQQHLRQEQSKDDLGAEYFVEHLGVTSQMAEKDDIPKI